MIYNYSITKIMGTGMGYDDTELRREISDIKSTLDVKANVEQVPTKISELSNDSGYITSIPSEYITETELEGKGYITSIPEEYITETELNAKDYVTTSSLDSKGYLTSIPETYVTDTELDSKGYVTNSELEGKGYITGIPSEYVTETELNNKGYLTEHQDISNLATKDEIPAKYVTDIQLNYLDGSPRFATINRSDNTNSTIYFGTINDVLITSSNANFKLATTETVNAIEARVTALENDVNSANATIDEINSMI